jgi:phenylacetate-CoA ligase
MMIVRSARYLLTRLVFLLMGLPVERYRKEVERLWSMIEEDRLRELDGILSQNRPLNSKGEQVTGLNDLEAAPSLSKKQLRSQTLQSKDKNGAASFGRHTAGTTGEPTHVFLNRQELARMLGVRDYCFRHYGLKLGQREARLWGRPESGFKSRVKNFVVNRRVFHPVGSDAEQEIAVLLKWRPDYIYGYASLLLEAAKVLDRMDISFEPPKCVVCTAESILPAQKEFISRVFRAPLAEEYGSTEFDVIAFECIDGHRHLVNPWLIVEEGEENGLISDASRATQDLIRYELGDSFTLRNSECSRLGSASFLEQLDGRTIDLFFYINKDHKIHIITIARLLDRYFSENDDVLSFQIVQNEYSSLEVVINSVPARGMHHFQSFLETEVGKTTNAEVEVILSIDGSRTTRKKRNYFIQNMKVPE